MLNDWQLFFIWLYPYPLAFSPISIAGQLLLWAQISTFVPSIGCIITFEWHVIGRATIIILMLRAWSNGAAFLWLHAYVVLMVRGVLKRRLCFSMAIWLLSRISRHFVYICSRAAYFAFVVALNLFRWIPIILKIPLNCLMLILTGVAAESLAVQTVNRTDWWTKSTHLVVLRRILPTWIWVALSLTAHPVGLVKDLIGGQGRCTRAIITMLVLHRKLVATTGIVCRQDFILELQARLLLHFLALTSSNPSREAFRCVVWGQLAKTIVTLLRWIILIMLLLDKTVSRKCHVLVLLLEGCGVVSGNGAGSARPILDFLALTLFS